MRCAPLRPVGRLRCAPHYVGGRRGGKRASKGFPRRSDSEKPGTLSLVPFGRISTCPGIDLQKVAYSVYNARKSSVRKDRSQRSCSRGSARHARKKNSSAGDCSRILTRRDQPIPEPSTMSASERPSERPYSARNPGDHLSHALPRKASHSSRTRLFLRSKASCRKSRPSLLSGAVISAPSFTTYEPAAEPSCICKPFSNDADPPALSTARTHAARKAEISKSGSESQKVKT